MNTKICFVLAIVAFAHVCEINGASRFNLPETLRSVKNSWTDKGKKAEEPIIQFVEMDQIEKGSELAKQVDAAVEEAKKDGTTGRFFKKFMGLNQNNQPTVIIVPFVFENVGGGSYTTTGTTGGTAPVVSTITSTNNGQITVTQLPNRFRNVADFEDDESEEEEMGIEEHEIEDDDEDVEEGKATKKRNNKKANQVRRKKNKNQGVKNSMNKGVSVDIPAQYRKYFNGRKQVNIPASMIQKARAQQKLNKNKNGGKRRIVKRKPNHRN